MRIFLKILFFLAMASKTQWLKRECQARAVKVKWLKGLLLFFWFKHQRKALKRKTCPLHPKCFFSIEYTFKAHAFICKTLAPLLSLCHAAVMTTFWDKYWSGCLPWLNLFHISHFLCNWIEGLCCDPQTLIIFSAFLRSPIIFQNSVSLCAFPWSHFRFFPEHSLFLHVHTLYTQGSRGLAVTVNGTFYKLGCEEEEGCEKLIVVLWL